MFDTIVAGVSIFVLGQLILKLLIDPVHDMKRHIGKVAHALIYHANVYTSLGTATPQRAKDAHDELRSLSSQLCACQRLIPVYDVTCHLFGLPIAAEITNATSSLIAIANMCYSGPATNTAADIHELEVRLKRQLGII